ncbi:MAG: site-specific tyrosine recombinase XerD [Bacteroidales bacterium]|nr:site-specific tyrosine recombinase XerD [Bacteroidales bacterium]
MIWEKELEDFKQYLKLEKGLSNNSINAYIADLTKLISYVEKIDTGLKPEAITSDHLRGMMAGLAEKKISPRTQSRVISAIKSFFRFLQLEEVIDKDPTALLETPKISHKLPVVLTIDEIERIINTIDVTKTEGYRNRAIIETLYSCGLRVSEVTELKMSNLFFESGYIKVEGKGSKERLVPIGAMAVSDINKYVDNYRRMMNIKKDSEDILFLNRTGDRLSRVMIFSIIKEATKMAGINKVVSPHTFRHSFATHLIQGGANVRAVQEMLGHESIMTTEIYTHLDNKHLRNTVENCHPYKEE